MVKMYTMSRASKEFKEVWDLLEDKITLIIGFLIYRAEEQPKIKCQTLGDQE